MLTMYGRVTICVPVFNESLVIVDYLRELENTFRNLGARVVLIDDCSSDDTILRIQEANFGEFVTVIRNSTNQGHGPSLVTSLVTASGADCEVIVTVDGDAEISAVEIQKLLATLDVESAHLVEGHRRQRIDPTFRKAVSLVARILIVVIGGRVMWSAKDANSPVRAYKRDALIKILNYLHADLMTPNLIVSMVARKLEMHIAHVEVTCRRFGSERVQGTTWMARFKNIPSRRFLLFCVSATFDLFRFGRRLRSH